MNIASIGYTDTGGAGLSSLKLHNALLKAGANSRFYVTKKNTATASVIKIELTPNTQQISRLPTSPEYPHTTFSTGLGGATPEYVNSIYQWADIILLRWIGGALSDLDISTLSYRKKIFWTLSDMAPFTGGCHYPPIGCTKYQENCQKCPLLENKETSSIILSRRLRIWKQENIHIISPSHWLAETARRSTLAKNSNISVIPTGVETDIFKSHPDAKAKLNISTDAKVLFFAADAVDDPRKGGDLLNSIINAISERQIDKLLVLTAGWNHPPAHPLVKHLGHLGSKEEMAIAYSAADCTILPYRYDNLPNILLESLCCGTPVACFSISGMAEKIIHGFNGLLAPPYDIGLLSECAINALKGKCSSRAAIAKHSRENLSVDTQAISYLKLFSQYSAPPPRPPTAS